MSLIIIEKLGWFFFYNQYLRPKFLTGVISPEEDVGEAECAQELGEAAFPTESGEATWENCEKLWPKVEVA